MTAEGWIVLLVIVGVVIALAKAQGGPSAPSVAQLSGDKTIIRMYRGHNQADAVAAMQIEAAELAEQGYRVSAQSWAAGSWGCGAFFLAVVLFLVLIGILVFLYMLLVKPDGTLTVTYTLERDPRPPLDPSLAITDQLKKLGELRDAGVLTPEEFEAKKAQLLARL